MRIRKGDTVKVLYGKDSGKTGKVVRVVKKERRVVVEGVNLFKKHVKGDGQKRSSEIVTISKALPASKVMLIDPSDNKPTRVKYELASNGKKRVSVRSKKSIDASKTTPVKKEAPKSEKKTTKKSKSKKE